MTKYLATLILVFLFSGCISLPHSNQFKPVGKMETEFFKVADPEVYPNDVRADLTKYSNKFVCWTGIVIDSKLIELADQPEYSYWYIKAKHHYYDWIVDHGIQTEKFFLSQRGEGEFIVIVPRDRYKGDSRDKQIKEIQSSLTPGTMVFGYGRPDKVEKGVIRLNGGFATPIQKQFVNVTKMNYGKIILEK